MGWPPWTQNGLPADEQRGQGGMFEFEWDLAKAAGNLRKHGVGFDLAATVFRDPLMQTILDEEHSESDERWVTMGYARNGRLLVVSHIYTEAVDEGALVRLISARPATRNERRQYESDE